MPLPPPTESRLCCGCCCDFHDHVCVMTAVQIVNSRSFGSAAPEGGIGVTMLVPLLDLLCACFPAEHISRHLVARVSSEAMLLN